MSVPALTTTLPTVVGPAGLQPISPLTLRQTIVDDVSSTNPGYTANLPGTLVEDIVSTDVAAVALCDAARVDLINSLSPYVANPYLLQLLGNVYGVPIAPQANTSVNVIFTGNAPGYIIPAGFSVGDGTYNYEVQDGGIIGTNGQSGLLTCIATQPGIWAIPPGTVTQLGTSVPTPYQLSVSNPQAGTPGIGQESLDDYRARVLQAGLAIAQGVPSLIKTSVGNVPGVAQRLIAVKQYILEGSGVWEIIVGGGDIYQVAYAIYTSMFDINLLTGSQLQVSNISKANPGVVTTNLAHGFTTGQVITITDMVGMDPLIGAPLTATVIDNYNFSIGIDTTLYPPYVSGGQLSPNYRQANVTIIDYPDTYLVQFVLPPQQRVSMVVTWNTELVNVVDDVAIAQLAVPALVNYVNSVVVGQPLNVYVMDRVFQDAVAAAIPKEFVIRILFAVSINGGGVVPQPGTGIIEGDPESYFFCQAPDINVVHG